MSGLAKIKKERYFYYLEKGIPYEGEVEGLGYAITTVQTTAYPANKSGTAFFLVLKIIIFALLMQI